MHLSNPLLVISLVFSFLNATPVKPLIDDTLSSEIIAKEQFKSLEPLAKDYSGNLILIRHGEKNRDETGLSRCGKKRAECLREILGRKSKHNVGLIMAESYNAHSGKRARPFLTVSPLAKDLDLNVNLDCERDDHACVRAIVKEFTRRSSKDVLICWKHSELAGIAYALGANGKTPYPADRFDIMWIMANQKIIAKKSEGCRGLDDHRKFDSDSDLILIDQVDDPEARARYEASLSLQQEADSRYEDRLGQVEDRDWELEEWEEVSNQILMEGRNRDY